MKIEQINVLNTGYVDCRSRFYSSCDILSQDVNSCFNTGINRLYGEVDSGVWAVSYLLSMYNCRPKDFVLFEKAEVIVNDAVMSLSDLMTYSCYMDKLYPLFSTKKSVRKLVTKGIRANKLDYTPDEIKELFCIRADRFERPLSQVGNEIFKTMAAIGYCHEKQVFCFPWLSQKRFEYYHRNMTGLLEILESLNTVIIVPIGKNNQ